MIHEEYLNPEYMYRCINKLCKTDGWILNDFSFGQLVYSDNFRPILMQNNHRYNLVYKFSVYKSPTDYSFIKKGADLFRFRPIDIRPIRKTVYFDINNECFINKDEKIEKGYIEWPSCFNCNGQWYYAIYNQPSVLRYHSTCKGMRDFHSYVKDMELTAQNVLDLGQLVYNMRRHAFVDDPFMFYFDTREDAIKAIEQAIAGTHNIKDMVFVEVESTGLSLCRVSESKITKDYKYRLPIHSKGVPVFYTTNVLELTLPIAKAVYGLSQNVANAFKDVTYAIQSIARATDKLMGDAMEFVRHAHPDEDFKSKLAWEISTHVDYRDPFPFSRTSRELNDLITPSECQSRANEYHRKNISLGLKGVSESEERLKAYAEQIKKLAVAPASLNKFLDVSDIYAKIQNEYKQLMTHQQELEK